MLVVVVGSGTKSSVPVIQRSLAGARPETVYRCAPDVMQAGETLCSAIIHCSREGYLGETLDELNMDSDEKADVIVVFAGLKGDIVEQQEE